MFLEGNPNEPHGIRLTEAAKKLQCEPTLHSWKTGTFSVRGWEGEKEVVFVFLATRWDGMKLAWIVVDSVENLESGTESVEPDQLLERMSEIMGRWLS